MAHDHRAFTLSPGRGFPPHGAVVRAPLAASFRRTLSPPPDQGNFATMNIAIYGAGGVGGYYGGVLARAGHQVSLIARGRPPGGHSRSRGLACALPAATSAIRPAAATDDPGEIGPGRRRHRRCEIDARSRGV